MENTSVTAADEEDIALVEMAAEIADIDPEAFLARPRKFRSRFLAQAKKQRAEQPVSVENAPNSDATTSV
jgi:hypothetical protein